MIGEKAAVRTNLRRSVAIAYTLIFLMAAVCAPAAMAALKTPPAVVKLGSIGLDKPLAPGASSTLIIDARVDDGWHINSNHPSSPDYIPTQVELTVPNGVTAGAVQYPAAGKNPSRIFLRGTFGLHR